MAQPVWNALDNLSIQTYAYNADSNSCELGDRTTVYANDHHQAIVVISFNVLDPDGKTIVASDLGTIGIIKAATQLLDYETGDTFKDEVVWKSNPNPTIFACPLGSAQQDSTICADDSIDDKGKVTMRFYVSTDGTNGQANLRKAGMEVSLKTLSDNANTRILKSWKNGDYQEFCILEVINKKKIPSDLLGQKVIYIDNNKSDSLPTARTITPALEDYYRTIHHAFYLDFSKDSSEDSDFDHNNRVFRVGLYQSDQYNWVQTSAGSDNDTESSEKSALTEPCCFLDQRDGFYNYKGYLWPLGFYTRESIFNHDPIAVVNSGENSGNYTLFQSRFPNLAINPKQIFGSKKSNVDSFDENSAIYLTIYLTFGDMVQYYKRQAFFKLEIIDQYGNIIDLNVHPETSPSIFNKLNINKCGIGCFNETREDAVKWLSADPVINDTDTIGHYEDTGFWLVAANDTNWGLNRTLNYQINGENFTTYQIISIEDPNTFTQMFNHNMSFRTYRIEGKSTSSSISMEQRTYKMTMIDQHEGEAKITLGAMRSSENYYLYSVPIVDVGTQEAPTFIWSFFPVWEKGCFIAWINSKQLNYQSCTLIENDDPSYGYELGDPYGRNDRSLFSTVQAFNFKSDKYIDWTNPVTNALDTGNGGTDDNPYAADNTPGNVGRGDWAAVGAPMLVWDDGNTYMGNSVYSNGLNQVCLTLNFDALTWNGTDGGKLENCSSKPTLDYVKSHVSHRLQHWQ